VKKLKYDGIILEEIKKDKTLQLKLKQTIKKLCSEFTISEKHCKEIILIAMELYYKKSIDNEIKNRVIIPKKEFQGADKLLYYIKSIEKYEFITEKIVIKFKNVYEYKKEKEPKLKKHKEIRDAQPITIDFCGRLVLKLIETILRNSKIEHSVKAMADSYNQELGLFANNYAKADQANAQYSKTACKEISNYLKKIKYDDKIAYISIAALEEVNLVNSVLDYNLQTNKKTQSINTIRSRIYNSFMR
jgi:hypothetical protein